MKKIDVFVSYNQADRKVAMELVTFLEANRLSCYIAPRDIDPGRAYASCLMEAIDNCKVVLLVASDAINGSEHVLNEVDVIVERKKPILPVFIEEFNLNDDYRYYLGRKQWVVAYPESMYTYHDKILNTIMEYCPIAEPEKPVFVEEKVEKPSTPQKTTTVFDYLPERGIMINPEDHQRNISFRNDTLINMMGEIYQKVETVSNKEQAEEIFYSSGYKSGKNFAERINDQWDVGHSVDSIKYKLNKWCEFDSAVGWGKFSIKMDYDPANDCLSGQLTISEAFIVDKVNKTKICGFIRGYCTGVIETLLGSVSIDLKCAECPLNSRFNCNCVFNFKSK